MRPATDIPESVMEEAVACFDDVAHPDSLDDVTRREFVAWLMRSPVNIEAFLSVSAVHTGLSTATEKDASWLEELLTDDASNIVSLAQTRTGNSELATAVSAGRSANRPRRWAPWKRVGMAASLLMATAIGTVALWPSGSTPESERYVTGLGEQRTVVLDDGSVMQINTDSAVEVRYGTAAREVVLTRGEAIFDVEKEPARPFRVRSGSVTVEAVGTRFNVYRQTGQTIVTVVEGRVKVQQSGSSAPATPVRGDIAQTPIDAPRSGGSVAPAPVEVRAGERVSIRNDGAIADTGRIDAERATAWTQRRLMFDDDSLAAIVDEFNRYNRSKLVINDVALRERRMSGIFNVDVPEAFVEVLATMTPIRVVERADGTLEIFGAARSASPPRR